MASMSSNWTRQVVQPVAQPVVPVATPAPVAAPLPPQMPYPAPATQSWFDAQPVGSRGSGQPTNTTMPVPAPTPQNTAGGSTTPQTTPQNAAQGRNTGDPLARIEQLQGQYQPTPEGFRQILSTLQREGYPVVAATHAGGTQMSDDAIVLPNGEVYDIISSVGAPNAAWSLQHTDNYDPNRNIVKPNGHFESFGDYLQSAGLPAPTAQPMARSSGGGGGGTLTTGGAPAGSIASGVPGFTTAGSNWQAGIDPSYEFTSGEALRALERSSAARGTLLTGGTLKGIMRLGADLGSREYGNVFNRNTQLAQLGLNATNNAANLGSSYSGQLGNLASNFGDEAGNLSTSQAGNLGNLTSGQINALVGLITGQGNATAAGQVGASNATRGTIADLANIFGQYFANQNKPAQNRVVGTNGVITG